MKKFAILWLLLCANAYAEVSFGTGESEVIGCGSVQRYPVFDVADVFVACLRVPVGEAVMGALVDFPRLHSDRGGGECLPRFGDRRIERI